MKSKKSNTNQNGKGHVQAALAKAAATKRLAQAAKQHLRSVKAEHKQARKAFKQAKKAAKRARQEAKAVMKMVKGKETRAPRTARTKTGIPVRTSIARTVPTQEVDIPATPNASLAV
jgi:hypothetical protein